jgi:hypothetical protein
VFDLGDEILLDQPMAKLLLRMLEPRSSLADHRTGPHARCSARTAQTRTCAKGGQRRAQSREQGFQLVILDGVGGCP